MTITFRTKLLASHGVIALVAALVAAFVIEVALAEELEDRIDSRLESQAQGVAKWMGRARHFERIAGRLGTVVDAHVTLIDKEGVVLGDSEIAAEEVAKADNQGDAPEVRAAQSGEVGRATRYSVMRGEEMRYLAVPGPYEMVIRLGVPTKMISDTRSGLRPRLFLAAAGSLVIAFLLAGVIARALSQRVSAMRAMAEQIGRGDYDLPPPSQAGDEFGVLSRTLVLSASHLARLDAMRREFTADVAHELRTPVTSIRGFAETLSDPSLNDTTRAEFVQTIHRNAIRISKLVDELLLLQRLENADDSRPPLEPVPLRKVVQSVFATLLTFAGERNATLTEQIGDDLRLLADADSLERLVQNLVENGVKYGGEGVQVSVAAERKEGNVLIRVRDNGPGIPEEALPRLFERFFRLDKGRSRKEGGSGLGLAIVKELAESMNGSVTVASTVGEGTTFTVTMPAA